MRLGHIELFVSNPQHSKDFYLNTLGFELVAEQGENFIWLKCGQVEILLRRGDNGTSPATYQQSPAGLVLYTENLQQTAADLSARGLQFKGTDGSDGCLTFTDPDGHWFQLVNPNHE